MRAAPLCEGMRTLAQISSLSALDPSNYDILIVGSGPAGCSLADRLGAKGVSCLIIETGRDGYDPDIQTAYTAMDTRGHFGDQHWAQHWIRAFGGTSMVWGGWCAPLDEQDFEAWPISRADLRPYYDIAADILKLDRVINSYDAAYRPGFRFKPFRTVYGAMRFGEAYQTFLTDAGPVDVLLGVTVSSLEPNMARDRVTALTLHQQDGTQRRISLADHQRLVLAAGGMGNAQLLLNPAPGSDTGIGNESDQVGRYLMEHPHYIQTAALVGRKRLAPPAPPSHFGAFVPNLLADRTTYAKIGKLSVAMELVEREINPADRVERFLSDKYQGDFIAYTINIRSEMRASPDNRVTLAPSRDPAGLPRLKTMCMAGSDTVRPIFQVLEELGKTVLARDEGRVFIHNDTLVSNPSGGGHTMGTTAMGRDPRVSVVDANCKVHRYANLYVAGSSVFTSGGSANPTLTLIALAARLADHLTGAA